MNPYLDAAGVSIVLSICALLFNGSGVEANYFQATDLNGITQACPILDG